MLAGIGVQYKSDNRVIMYLYSNTMCVCYMYEKMKVFNRTERYKNIIQQMIFGHANKQNQIENLMPNNNILIHFCATENVLLFKLNFFKTM